MEESALSAAPRVAPALNFAAPAGPTIRCERVIASDLATIWKALLDAEDTRVWFAEVRCDPRVGAPICIAWEDGDCAYGEIVTCEPDACLAYTWSWQGIGMLSLVTWRLAPAAGGGVTVTLTHQLADDFDRAEYTAGWQFYLGRLADMCEGQAVPQGKLAAHPSAVEMSIYLAASPMRVWMMLTDETHVGRWFSRCHLEPWLGGSVAFFGARTGRLLDRGTVTAFEPGVALAFTWTEPGWPADTVVKWTLVAIPGGTRLSVSHGGWNHLPLALARGDRLGKTAWRVALADLRALLAADEKIPSDGFRLSRVLQGTPAAAWKAMTSVASVRRWIGMPDEGAPTVAYEATLGGEVRLEAASGDVLIGRVTTFEPGHRIVWTVRAGGIGPECIFTFELMPETPGYLFGSYLICTGRGFELEHDRAAAERKAGVWMLQLQEVVYGEEPTRVERRAPDPISLTLDLTAPTTRVFAMLTREDELPRWACESAEFGAGMGGTFAWVSRGEGDREIIEGGRVVEFRPGERLAVAWMREGAGWGAPVVMTFDLRPLKGGTRMRCDIGGWDALPLVLRDDERAAAAIRWRRALGLLRDLLHEEASQHEHVQARRAARAGEFIAEPAVPVVVVPKRERGLDEVRFGTAVPSRLPYRIEEDEHDPDSVKPRRSAVGHARTPRPRDADGFDQRPRPARKSPPRKKTAPEVERGTRGIQRDPRRLWKEKPAELVTLPEARPTRGGARPPARPTSRVAGPLRKSKPSGGANDGGYAPRPSASSGRGGASASRGASARPTSRGATTSPRSSASRSDGPAPWGGSKPRGRGGAPAPRGSENMTRGAYGSATRGGNATRSAGGPTRGGGAPAGRGGAAAGRSSAATIRGGTPTGRSSAATTRGGAAASRGATTPSRGGASYAAAPARPAARPAGGKKPVNRGGPRPATPRNTKAGATIGGRSPKPPRRGR